MKRLFEIDLKDYKESGNVFRRPSARAIIRRGDKIALVYSQKEKYYKFPGGGIESGESNVDAMIRETREEAGLVVIPESVREFGYVHRIQRSSSDPTECFVQDNFYYLCDALENTVSQDLDDYESEEVFVLEFVDPQAAIRTNRAVTESPYSRVMFEREAKVLEMLIAEGLL